MGNYLYNSGCTFYTAAIKGRDVGSSYMYIVQIMVYRYSSYCWKEEGIWQCELALSGALNSDMNVMQIPAAIH